MENGNKTYGMEIPYGLHFRSTSHTFQIYLTYGWWIEIMGPANVDRLRLTRVSIAMHSLRPSPTPPISVHHACVLIFAPEMHLRSIYTRYITGISRHPSSPRVYSGGRLSHLASLSSCPPARHGVHERLPHDAERRRPGDDLGHRHREPQQRHRPERLS